MQIPSLPEEIINRIRLALAEDIGTGDVTTNSIVPADEQMKGHIVAKQHGVIAGLDVAQVAFALVDDRITFEPLVAEGQHVENRQELARICGPARGVLTAERVALNFLGRMSGIATLTRQFVDSVTGTHTVILDTRKTAPGMRLLDKLSVVRGGGQNHRVGLYDMILIKDNHIDFAGSLAEAVKRVRAAKTGLQIEVEARTVDDVQKALDLGVDRILLDNMPLDLMREAVTLSGGRAKLEASGNINVDTVHLVAQTGVDYISVGALTHSVRVFDISFLWVGEEITSIQ